jgi:hypothetical protein
MGLAQNYTDDERLLLRNAGIVALLDLDGVVYFPRGQTMAGTPMSIVRGVQQLMAWLEDLRTSLVNDVRHLDSFLDAVSQQRSRELSWRPFVQGEDLGFTTGEHAVIVGRLP